MGKGEGRTSRRSAQIVGPTDEEKAAAKAVKMAEEGADILDLGAESTRPGAPRVPEEQERARMSAAVAAIRRELPRMPLSIDTTRASVAEAALENGADVNLVADMQHSALHYATENGSTEIVEQLLLAGAER